MEMFGFRRPAIRRVFAKAWEQFREFLFVAMPIVVIASAYAFRVLQGEEVAVQA